MPTGQTLLGTLLQGFAFTFTGGYTRLLPDALWLLAAFATLELILCGLLWAFAESNVAEQLLWKVLAISVTMWLITAWPTLMRALRDGFITAGIIAGGDAISLTDFTDPGNVIDFGFSVTAVIFQRLRNFSGLEAMYNIVEVIFSGVAAWMTVLAFMIVGIHIFKALLEFYLVGTIALFLLPFGVFRHTAFIAERAFGLVVSHALKLFLLALLTSAMLPILVSFKLPSEPTFREVMLLFGASLVLVALNLSAHHIAQGLCHGAPSLHAGHALQAASTLAATATILGSAGTSALSAAGWVGRAGLSGAGSLAAAARIGATDFRTGQMTSQRYPSSVVGGAAGMARYLGVSVTQGFQQAVHTGRIRAAQRLNHPNHP